MQQVITNAIPQIQELYRRHFIKSLYVFGSAVREDFSEASDDDFPAEFSLERNIQNSDSVFNYYDNRERLCDKLTELLSHEIDLPESKALTNKYLRYFINQEKQLLYAQA